MNADRPLTAAEEAELDALALPPPRPWIGDFDGMRERRVVRVLVPYSRTLFFLDRGTPRGLSHDLAKAFESALNEKYKNKSLPIRVEFIPLPRGRLLPALVEGLGDIAAGMLPVTPERKQIVDFSDPFDRGVKEIVVTGKHAAVLASVEDLAGHDVVVRRSSSYYEHLQSLNERLRTMGRPAINLIEAEEDLEDEDLLEMVSGGHIDLTVVDRFQAVFWAQILPGLVIRDDLVVDDGGDIAWAVRKNSPLLLAEINAFIKTHKLGTAFGNQLFHEYLKSTKFVERAAGEAELAQYRALVSVFEKYGSQYAFDYLMLVAQGFQESKLDQTLRSPRGAVGVMQLLPATAASPEIGITEIDKDAEKNIHAGIKYMRLLLDRYLDDQALDERNRTLLGFAAYNAGPANLRKFRRLAEKSGLDPNVWFDNVEIAAAQIVGRETVDYVGNIHKYYIAYKLIESRERGAAQ